LIFKILNISYVDPRVGFYRHQCLTNRGFASDKEVYVFFIFEQMFIMKPWLLIFSMLFVDINYVRTAGHTQKPLDKYKTAKNTFKQFRLYAGMRKIYNHGRNRPVNIRLNTGIIFNNNIFNTKILTPIFVFLTLSFSTPKF